jgi:hypothetical protein
MDQFSKLTKIVHLIILQRLEEKKHVQDNDNEKDKHNKARSTF